MRKNQASTRWLLTDKILAVMREKELTYHSWALRLGISQQRLHANITGKHRGKEVQNIILTSLLFMTDQPLTDFYREEG